MIYLQGELAFTEYRRKKILENLQQISSAISGLEIYYTYFIDVRAELTIAELERLIELLPNSVVIESMVNRSEFEIWVVPRLGTISPWSSKATEIAAICDLEKIARIERGYHYVLLGLSKEQAQPALLKALHDPLTESVLKNEAEFAELFTHREPQPLKHILLQEEGLAALVKANVEMGLSLSQQELEYLLESYHTLKRNPTDVELMMFAQVNSEHCRHKIFNAAWNIDNQQKDQSLFSMIRHTHAQHPQRVLVAYKDNAAVMRGEVVQRFFINPETKQYESVFESAPFVLKVETHNHPTAISPFPGAATGSGGEIRDEAATGRGSMAKAGLCGFSVSHLHIPNFKQPWEKTEALPPHIATALEIMLQAPIGAASFNNEFGRPNVLGYFRNFAMTFESTYGVVRRGYLKPIMIAGGVGTIRAEHIQKHKLLPGAPIIVLGGPAMAIGLGGGSASSRHKSEEQAALDFASVQRSNPEMQRRAQEVINACCALGKNNPILSIHDVGAGGLSNALPELVHDSGLGGKFYLRSIPNAEPGMTPLEIWCNEAQERYVLSIKPEQLELFTAIAHRERAPFAIVGEASTSQQLSVDDRHFNDYAVDMPMKVLFESMPRLLRSDVHTIPVKNEFATKNIDLAAAIERVLAFPTVASKNFLIMIGDRSVGGLVARDQCVGPWQIPVADCAVTSNSFQGYLGEAMAIGERAPIALLHHAASARMAVGEAITNIAAARIDDISEIVLSANWMAAADYPGEGAGLYDAVQTIAMELCPSLKIAIPVGKDSLSMRTSWKVGETTHSVTSPLSLVITAAAKVSDVRKTLTPELKTNQGKTHLILVDLGKGANLLGASVLLQTYNVLGQRPPDVDNPRLLANFFKAIQSLNRNELLLAYHDRSDGGLLASVCEMMFAAHVGVNLTLDVLGNDVIASLFAEELGAVLQVRDADLDTVLNILEGHELENCTHIIGELNAEDVLSIQHCDQKIYVNSRIQLQRLWSEASFRMQALRDNALTAQQEFDEILNAESKGLSAKVNFAFDADALPAIVSNVKPKIAILREQGVNGHVEMAAAFDRAGFICVDVHMSDLIRGECNLAEFKGLAAVGGFSYGDVLGAGRGWAQSILLHSKVRDEFQRFFARSDTFTVGMCNGCQMLSYLRDLIPGAEHWPHFTRNLSEQFEARLTLVKVADSPSIIFQGMQGSVLPIVVSHGEGHADFTKGNRLAVEKQQLVALQYVNDRHEITEAYPANPNGSVNGITALTSRDGRVTIMMPHPERIFRTLQLSWHDPSWGENSPWIKLFYNARLWVN